MDFEKPSRRKRQWNFHLRHFWIPKIRRRWIGGKTRKENPPIRRSWRHWVLPIALLDCSTNSHPLLTLWKSNRALTWNGKERQKRVLRQRRLKTKCRAQNIEIL